MVERYIIKKSLMKPIQAYSELKRQKYLESKGQDSSSMASKKDGKSSYSGFEQYMISQGLLSGPAKGGLSTPGTSF